MYTKHGLSASNLSAGNISVFIVYNPLWPSKNDATYLGQHSIKFVQNSIYLVHKQSVCYLAKSYKLFKFAIAMCY